MPNFDPLFRKIEPDGPERSEQEQARTNPASTPARVHELKRTVGTLVATSDESQERIAALEEAYRWQMRTTGLMLFSMLFIIIATKQIGKQLELTTGAVRAAKLSANASV